ncbi:MAG: DUF6638 family protein [bacterium]
MKKTLHSEGLIYNKLFPVEGELVENYNRALECIIGKKTQLKSFSIDKRGVSPELIEELGDYYLQCGSANRYTIIVSPNQKDAGLIQEDFSFDSQLFDFLYENYLPGIGVITRVDSLYGELEDGIRVYNSLEDILLQKKVSIRLKTPSEFIEKAKRLQAYVKELEKDPNLLIANDCEAPKKIYELVLNVGDVRGYDITNIQVTRETETFYSRLFKGVYVFRSGNKKKGTLQIRRPGSNPIDTDKDTSDLPFYQPQAETSSSDLINLCEKIVTEEKEAATARTVVIYSKEDYKPKDGPLVAFININSTEQVVEFLIRNRYAKFSADLIESRLSRIEDLFLLEMGHDLIKFDYEDRQKALSQYSYKMPQRWTELMDIKRGIALGYLFDSLMEKTPTEIKIMLLRCVNEGSGYRPVVENLLTKLWTKDFERMYKFNIKDLEEIFESCDCERTKDYIVKILKEIR